MFRSILAFLLVVLLALPVSASHTYHGVLNYPWGTTKQKIINDLKPYQTKIGNLVISYNKNNLSLNVVFDFHEDKLIGGTFAASVDAASPYKTALFCDDIASNLVLENGQPDQQFINENLGPILRWINYDTEITLVCRIAYPGKAIIIFKQRDKITL